jgi:hypothetical protein
LTRANSLAFRAAGAPRAALMAVAVAATVVLALSVPPQLFDTNFYSLWEATSLLAGDHPYRDFFEWGIPLQAVVSAAAQSVFGYRMISEFVFVHWTFIAAGAVLSFDLAYRVSRSLLAAGAMAATGIAVLPDTATFHYPKMFFYPAAIWLAWRYIDRPGLRDAAGLGLLTAVAFLFRHDHGVYIGVASVLACLLARGIDAGRRWRDTVADAGTYTAVATLALLPWLVTVQRTEGVTDYVRARAELYSMWSAGSEYGKLLRRNPFRLVDDWVPAIAPRPGVVSFAWQPPVDDARQAKLESRFGLRRLEGPDADQRWRYAVDNVYDPKLYGLARLTGDTQGFEWDLLERLNEWLPAVEPSRTFLAQVTAFVPFFVLASVGWDILRTRRLHVPVPASACAIAVGAVLLIVVDQSLFREPSYAHLVAPLTGALAARFFTSWRDGLPVNAWAAARFGRWARLAIATAILAITAVTTASLSKFDRLFTRGNAESVADTFDRLLASPPIDAFVTTGEVARWTNGESREAWNAGTMPYTPEIMLRYMHDCVGPADRVLVSGSTPFQIGYLVERPVAGGHLFWHHRWRADSRHELELLALLERQSVPFAFSTHDPVMNDLKAYPRIHAHFTTHYQPLPGSSGRLLVDARRRPTGHFGPYQFPCFK